MSSSFPTALVVTQVYPQQFATVVAASSTVSGVSSALEKFLKGQPKALGTVQIMIGLIIILFGAALTKDADTVAVYSGMVYWGALLYISSGALTVAADYKLKACLVNGALGMNIFSTITAGIAIILLSFDLVLLLRLRHYYCPDYGSSNFYKCMLYTYENMYKDRKHGIIGVLLVFSILEFIVSICVSAFACKAICHSDPEQVIIFQNPNGQVNPASSNTLPIPTPNTYETAIPSSVTGQHSEVLYSNHTMEPAEYADILN